MALTGMALAMPGAALQKSQPRALTVGEAGPPRSPRTFLIALAVAGSFDKTALLLRAIGNIATLSKQWAISLAASANFSIKACLS